MTDETREVVVAGTRFRKNNGVWRWLDPLGGLAGEWWEVALPEAHALDALLERDKRLAKYSDRLDAAEEALRFYAEERDSAIERDEGDIARAYLAKHEKREGS